MAYAAVISLKQTIHRLLNFAHTTIAPSSREILEFAYKHVTSLHEFLKQFYDVNRKKWNALDVKIREAVQNLEDALELQVSNQYLSLAETEILRDLVFEEARHDVNSFVETIKEMEDKYMEALNNPSPAEVEEEDDDGSAVSSYIDFGVKMVGLSKELAEIKDHLLKPMMPTDFGVFSLVGEIGSCRSITAKALFDEVFVGKEQPFDCGAWVTIGRNYQFTDIIATILAQTDDRGLIISDADVEKLGSDLYRSLKGRRYMIVIDDIEDTEVWSCLRKYLPEQDNGREPSDFNHRAD